MIMVRKHSVSTTSGFKSQCARAERAHLVADGVESNLYHLIERKRETERERERVNVKIV